MSPACTGSSLTQLLLHFPLQKNKNKKKGKDEKCGSEVTTPENSASPGMMDMHGELPAARVPVAAAAPFTFQAGRRKTEQHQEATVPQGQAWGGEPACPSREAPRAQTR